jgi:hypothetical protein
MEYVLVDRNDNIVDKKDLSDIGINGARTFFIKRKQIVEESFDKLWKVMTKKEYDLNQEAFIRKPSSESIEWWKDEESYLDIDAPITESKK